MNLHAYGQTKAVRFFCDKNEIEKLLEEKMKNFKVRLLYFQRNKDAWVECKVIFHLQAYNVSGHW